MCRSLAITLSNPGKTRGEPCEHLRELGLPKNGDHDSSHALKSCVKMTNVILCRRPPSNRKCGRSKDKPPNGRNIISSVLSIFMLHSCSMFAQTIMLLCISSVVKTNPS